MNKLIKYSAAIILFTLFACEHEKKTEPVKPDHLLSMEEVSAVLTEMHLAEAIISDKPLVQDSMYQAAVDAYATIYKKHHIKEDDFKNSFNYYKMMPVEMDSIYADIITRLNEIDTKYSNTSFSKIDSVPHIHALK